MYIVGPQDPLDMPHAQRIPTGHRPRRLGDNLECNAIAPRVLEGSYVTKQKSSDAQELPALDQHGARAHMSTSTPFCPSGQTFSSLTDI